MYAIKRELKLNKVETSLMRGCAGFKRWVLTQHIMKQPEYAWMKQSTLGLSGIYACGQEGADSLGTSRKKTSFHNP
ncbi:MAG: hypothetical protein ACRCZS_11480 [Chroococcidiopsis sp.]